MKTWFSSDWHLGHANIIKYDKRPFRDTDHMNEVIIGNHNALVAPDDYFYFLGDFAMGDRSRAEEWLKRVNGVKFFIKGNHDKKDMINLYKTYGTCLGELKEIRVGEQRITLCHYAMKVWNKSHHGSWHLYGHSHGSLPDDPESMSFDVGVNNWEYAPLEFEDVKRIMSKKTFKPIDHHGAREHEIGRRS